MRKGRGAAGWDQEEGPGGSLQRDQGWSSLSLPHRYAEVVVASENSVHKLLELLPGKILNGDKVEVRLATRQNLSQFEAQARKRECGAGAVREGGSTSHTSQIPPGSAARPSPASPRDGGRPCQEPLGVVFPGPEPD